MADKYDSFLDAKDDKKLDDFLDAPAPRKPIPKVDTELSFFEKLATGVDDLLGKSRTMNIARQALDKASPIPLPNRQDMVDLSSGAASTMRGTANLLSGDAKLGEAIWPSSVASKDSGYTTAGKALDPAALAIGGGVAKVLPYAPVLGKGIVEGVKAVGKNALSAGTAGSIVGGLSGESLEDAAAGGGVGMLAGIAAPAVTGSVGKIIDAIKGRLPTLKAKTILEDVIKNKADDVKAAWTANTDDTLTAAQAAAPAGSDLVAAAGDRAAKQRSQDFTDTKLRQKSDAINDLARLAGGQTQTEAKVARESSKSSLNAITAPMREAELGAANAAAKGLQPLDTKSMLGELSTKLDDPKIGVSDVNKRVLTKVGRKIQEWTEKSDGVIDANALYEIRKNAVNEEVERLMRGSDPTAQAKRAAGILKEVRPLIDDAIEKAGGTGWRDYLKTFEQGMTQINQKKLNAKLLDTYKRSPDEFLSIAQGEKPDVVRKIMGDEFDVSKALGSSKNTVDKVANAMLRNNDLEMRAAAGSGELNSILAKKAAKFRFPNFLNRETALANKGLDIAESRLDEKAMEAFYEAMKSGKGAMKLLNELPAEQRNALLQLAIKARKSGGLAGLSVQQPSE